MATKVFLSWKGRIRLRGFFFVQKTNGIIALFVRKANRHLHEGDL